MTKALKKLELQDKISSLKHEAKPEDKIKNHRQKLLDSRNSEREKDLMRTTFGHIAVEEKKVNEIRLGELEK